MNNEYINKADILLLLDAMQTKDGYINKSLFMSSICKLKQSKYDNISSRKSIYSARDIISNITKYKNKIKGKKIKSFARLKIENKTFKDNEMLTIYPQDGPRNGYFQTSASIDESDLVFTITDLATILKVSRPSLTKWIDNEIIKRYHCWFVIESTINRKEIGHRDYYILSEIKNAIKLYK